MSQKEIDAGSIDCNVVGGRASREHCPSCSHREEAACPHNSEASDESSDAGGSPAAAAEQPVDPVENPREHDEEEQPAATGSDDAPDAASTAEDNDTGEIMPANEEPKVDTTDDEHAGDEPVSGEEDRLAGLAEADDVLAPSNPGHESTADPGAPVTALEPVEASTDGDQDLWSQALQEVGEVGTVTSAAEATPEHIEAWHLHAEKLARMTAAHACLIGLALLEQKVKLQHGEFQAWIEANCSFSYPRAAVYMKTAKKLRQNYRTRYFCLSEMSIRELDRLLASPAKKKTSSKKRDVEDQTPTSPAETSVEDTDAAPPTNAISPEAGSQTDAEAHADVDDGGDSSHAMSEDAPPAAIDTNGDSGQTTTADEPGIAEESAVDGQECPESPDVGMALAALLKALQASPDMRAQAVTSIARIAELAGLRASGQGRRFAPRSTSTTTAIAKPGSPTSVLRWSDLTDMGGATPGGH
jgi:hypothetical protein